MAAGARSRNGCWTCRLRRKKCDERRPLCQTCDSLGIVCDGYGQRPDWMDGGDKEKEAAAETRRKIKSAARREPHTKSGSHAGTSPSLSRGVSTDPSQLQKSAEQTPKSEAGLEDDASSSKQPSERDPGIETSPASQLAIGPNPLIALETTPRDFSNQEDSDLGTFALPKTIQEREASLLMFYLDCVFPMQFKMYSPSIAAGGRGWIMSLFLRTPSLYHVTLAMSAHCLDLLSLPQSGHEYKTISFNELGLALQHLQQYIFDFNNRKDKGNLEENIKVCGCILQLIAFGCFKGDTDNWQLHLQAASNIVPSLIDALITLPPVTQSPYSTSVPTTSDTLVYHTDEMAMKFLTGIFLWFDICSSVCTGARPYLESHFERLIGGSEPKVDMKGIMGVEGWVMILIGKIACLDHWKREAQTNGRLSMIELVTRATNLEKELRSGLSNLVRTSSGVDTSLHDLLENTGGIPLGNFAIHSLYVTELYALTAITYLHIVVSGAQPELTEIRQSVEATIQAFKNLPDRLLPRATLWPLLITGSMASATEEQFFRDMMLSCGINSTSLGVGWNVLKILEECWRTRGVYSHVSGSKGYWASIMSNIGTEVLVY